MASGGQPRPKCIVPNAEALHLFDPADTIYVLLEQEYAKKNMGEADFVRYRRAIAKFVLIKQHNRPHINHSFLFERKGYR